MAKLKFDESGFDIDSLGDRVMAAVKMLASTNASRLESYMKRQRPWTDRTGRAKQGLNASVSQPNDHTVRITLAHGVDYGKWLELAHGKKYAIIKPTLNGEGQQVYKDFQNLLEKL